MCNFISQLKMNILLPTQVMNGPFDACGVDFDVFWNVDMDKDLAGNHNMAVPAKNNDVSLPAENDAWANVLMREKRGIICLSYLAFCIYFLFLQ